MIFSFIIYKCVSVIIILVWYMTIKIQLFYNSYGIEITLLTALSIHKVFFKRKHSCNFMFIENRFYWSTCYFLHKGTIFFIYWWHNVTFLFWKMILVDAFVIWHFSMNWSIPVCISSRASSKQICFGSWYFVFGYE